MEIKNNQEYFLTCPRGLENITAKDISSYCKHIKINNGGISFIGDLHSLYNINLNSRTGMYLLVKIYEFNAKNNKELYNNIFDFNWANIISPKDTFSIRTHLRSNNFNHTNYTTLKIKDAIVDRIRKDRGNRPYINKSDPKYHFVVINYQNSFKVYLNSSGSTLNQRGYRRKIHKASLNESLAAGLILLSGWESDQPFYDPMCGSGTLPIEAALIGLNIAPGIFRNQFAFQQWKDYDETLWYSILKETKNKITNSTLNINGYDELQVNVSLAKINAERIKIHKNVNFKKLDICNFSPKEKEGIIIINPPYGIRVGDISKLKTLYQQIGDTLKTNCCNMDAYIFSGNNDLSKQIGLRSKSKLVLKNGNIQCRLLHFPIRSGKYT